MCNTTPTRYLTACKATIAAMILAILPFSVAEAHVTVQPSESLPRANQRYVVNVPTEKPVPTIRVRLEFPADVTASRFLPISGWQRVVEKDSAGRITAVVWSGGQVAPEEFQEFVVIARNPSEERDLSWKAFQTYQDGETVEWTGPEGSDRPAPVTRVKGVPVAPVDAAAGPSQVAAPGVRAPDLAAVARPEPSPASDLSLFLTLGSLTIALLALVLAAVALRRPRASG